jgi:hypothetical protein
MAEEESRQNENATRKTDDYKGLGRSLAQNHFRTEKKKDPAIDPKFKISDFFTRRFLSWVYYYVVNRFGFNHKYLTYTGADNGLYKLTKSTKSTDDQISIAVVGDWATDTKESIAVTDAIRRLTPDYTVHIGDTYYVGAPHEIQNNFIGDNTPWVRGSVGSFALLGNHEMYARGIAYFDDLLPTLGLKDTSGDYQKQKASFFCLQNEHWRILGLDTGYHSIGKIPLIELIPLFSADSRFPKKMIKWLKEVVRLEDKNDKRALLILTHHQYISAFRGESEYLVPGNQLGKLIGTERPVIWLWGHEHKLSVFEKTQAGKKGVTAYGRCIGHGGMPIELDSKEFTKDPEKIGYSKLVMVDKRTKTNTNNYRLGFNGYSLIKINGADLNIEYRDVSGVLFSEKWTANGNGFATGKIAPPPPSGLLGPEIGKTWEDGIK